LEETTISTVFAWVVLGYAELLEWIATRGEEELAPLGGKRAIEARWLRAARLFTWECPMLLGQPL
jgi:hypothetical protein